MEEELDASFRELLSEWEKRNLTAKNSCGLGSFFFNVKDTIF